MATLPVRAELPQNQQLSPQKVQQLRSLFMDYGWRTQQTQMGNGGLEYLDPETGLVFIPQIQTVSVSESEPPRETLAGFTAYDPNHPLWKGAQEKKDNFYAEGAPILAFDATGNYKGAVPFTGAHKNSVMDQLLPLGMMALPFALTAMGVGAAGAAGGAASGAGGAGAAGTTFGVVDGTVGAGLGGSTGAMGAGGAGLSGTGLSMTAGGVTGLTPTVGTGLSLTGTSVAPGFMTAAAPGAGAIGAGLGAGLAGGSGTLLGPAALAGTTALSTGLTLPPLGAEAALSAAGGAGAGAGGGGGALEGVPPPANPFAGGGGGPSVTDLAKGFDWGSLVGPAASLIGGAVASNAAGDAADAQVESTRESNALLERMFNKQIELNEPFRKTGLAAGNRMSELLGIGGDPNAADYGSAARDFGEAEPVIAPWTKEAPQWQEYGEQAPKWRDYTIADFVKDPGYEFRLSEGQKLLERSKAGKGNFFSGATGKALTRYGQDYASGEFDKGFGRYQQGYQNRVGDFNSGYSRYLQGYQNRVGDYTGEYGRYQDQRRNTMGDYQDRFNRFQVSRSNKLAPFQSLYGSAQTSAGQVGNAAQNYGNQASQNITAAGNARAAGTVGQANAWTGAISNAWGGYQENELMKQLLARR
jgi:hypothetical protein